MSHTEMYVTYFCLSLNNRTKTNNVIMHDISVEWTQRDMCVYRYLDYTLWIESNVVLNIFYILIKKTNYKINEVYWQFYEY